MQKRIDDLLKIAYERGTTSKINQLYAALAAICHVEDLQDLHRRWNEMVEFKQVEKWDLEFNDELINPSKYGVVMDESGFGTVTLRTEGKAINTIGAGSPHPMMGTTGAGR